MFSHITSKISYMMLWKFPDIDLLDIDLPDENLDFLDTDFTKHFVGLQDVLKNVLKTSSRYILKTC